MEQPRDASDGTANGGNNETGAVAGPHRAAHWLLAISVLLPTVLFVTAAWYDREAAIRDAHNRVRSTTEVLAEQAREVLLTADLIVGRVEDRVQGVPWTTIGASRGVHDLLVRLQKEVPQIVSVFLVDPTGMNVASSRMFPMPRIDVREREYYLSALAARGGETGLQVSAPFRSKISHELGFTASHPRLVDGVFEGIIAVTISPDYFRSFYSAMLRSGREGRAALLREDGVLIVGFPESKVLAAPVAGDPLMLAAAASRDAIPAVGLETIGGERRLVGFVRVPGQNLFARYTESFEAVLAAWYVHVAIAGAFALLAGTALFLTARVVLRRADQDRLNFRRLMEETARRQRAEATMQQMQKMEALGRLSGGVAHDFNNLLTAILGSLELALKRVTDARLRRMLATAYQAAERGARLTAQMLAFSRQHEVILAPVDVNATLRGMDDLLRRTLGPIFTIHYDLETAVWRAAVDPIQLEVAFINLAVNARDAMAQGGHLTMRTRNVVHQAVDAGDAAREFVAVSVIDSGEGMSAETAASAFDPFFTTKAPGKGTGLGLSMVYGFASQIGGTATIESAIGRGTTITMLLPRTNKPLPEPPAAFAEAPPTAAALRILVVDDDDDVRMLAGDMVRELGHQVLSAPNGRAGLDILRGAPEVDLLLLDYAMPVMDGAAMAAEARDIAPGLPILFMTGYSEGELARPGDASGHPTLAKPFQLRELAGAIQATMERAFHGPDGAPFRDR